MRFEQDKDLKREKKAIEYFVKRFQGSYKKLGPNDVDYKVFPREDIDEDLDNSDDFPVDFDIIYDKPTSRAFVGKVDILVLVFLCTLSLCLSSSIYFPSSKTLHGNKSKAAN